MYYYYVILNTIQIVLPDTRTKGLESHWGQFSADRAFQSYLGYFMYYMDMVQVLNNEQLNVAGEYIPTKV